VRNREKHDARSELGLRAIVSYDAWVTPDLSCQNRMHMAGNRSSLAKAQLHLARNDAVLKRLIRKVGTCTLRYEPNRFASLARSIISQQISTKAALAIRTRLEQTLDGEGLTAAGILNLSDGALRNAGLSASKMKSLRDLAEHVYEERVQLATIHDLDDEAVIEALIPIRGIGRWTAQMFLIFSLGRLDVLPVDDLGLRAGVQDQYQLAALPDKHELTELAEPWRPYRSIATWYFWRSRGFVPQSERKARK
jgi:DNA-3-methyladenine glycosylase II